MGNLSSSITNFLETLNVDSVCTDNSIRNNLIYISQHQKEMSDICSDINSLYVLEDILNINANIPTYLIQQYQNNGFMLSGNAFETHVVYRPYTNEIIYPDRNYSICLDNITSEDIDTIRKMTNSSIYNYEYNTGPMQIHIFAWAIEKYIKKVNDYIKSFNL